MARTFGLTGGIASGKSSVSRIFKEQGIPIVDADVKAREIVAPGSVGLQAVVREFGPDFLQSDGTLDRPKLGAMVFTQPDRMRQLDDILSPLLLQACGDEIRALQKVHPLICFDAALLVEKKLHERFRPLVVVSTPEPIQLARLMARDGFNTAQAKARLSAQLPLADKVKVADYVIENDSTEANLRERTIGVLHELKERYT